jgi:hypothetical protein
MKSSNDEEFQDWFESEHASTPHNEFSEICECKDCNEELDFKLRCD